MKYRKERKGNKGEQEKNIQQIKVKLKGGTKVRKRDCGSNE